ncbi:hypothetical protein BTVI_13212 [Pitangus sulphuratus]|nr:hypothetical protein BTVI_13212 [Pitangus sulphuratus]
MAQNVVYADLKFAEGSPSMVPDEDDSPYENVLPGPVTAAPSPEHSPRRWHIPKKLLPASLVLLLMLLVTIVALGACYWQVTRSLQETSRDHEAEQGRLSQELSTREQSLEQAQLELEWARAELQRAWREGNISQQELESRNAELEHVKGVLVKTEKEMQEVQGKLNNSESTVSSLRACVNTVDKKLAEQLHPEDSGQWLCVLMWTLVTSGVPWGSILVPMLLNAFINDMNRGIECTLSNPAGDTQLRAAVDISEAPDAIQRDLDQLKEWAHGNIMRFNKIKCKMLHLCQGSPRYQHRLWGEQIKSSPAEKDLGVLVGERLDMTQPCALTTQKAKPVLSCIQSRVGSR